MSLRVLQYQPPPEGDSGLGSLLPAVRTLVPRDCTLGQLSAAVEDATGVPRARQRLMRVTNYANSLTACELLTHPTMGWDPLPLDAPPPLPAALPRDGLDRVVGDSVRLHTDLSYRVQDSFFLHLEERDPPGVPEAAAPPQIPSADDSFDPFGTAMLEAAPAAANAGAGATGASQPAPAAAGELDPSEASQSSSAGPAISRVSSTESGLTVINHASTVAASSPGAVKPTIPAPAKPGGAAARTWEHSERGFRPVPPEASRLVALLEHSCHSGRWKYNLPGTQEQNRVLEIDTRCTARQLHAALAAAMGLPAGTFTVRVATTYGTLLKLSDKANALKEGHWSKDGSLFLAPGAPVEAGQFLVHVFLAHHSTDVVPGTAWLPPPSLPPPPQPAPVTSTVADADAPVGTGEAAEGSATVSAPDSAPAPPSPVFAPAAAPAPSDPSYGGWLPPPLTAEEAAAIAQAVVQERDAEAAAAAAAASAAAGAIGAATGAAPLDELANGAPLSPLSQASEAQSSACDAALSSPGGASANAATVPTTVGFALGTDLPSARGSVASAASAPPMMCGGGASLAPNTLGHFTNSASSVTFGSPSPSPAHSVVAGFSAAPSAAGSGATAEPSRVCQLGLAKDTPLDDVRTSVIPRLIEMGALSQEEVDAAAAAEGVPAGCAYPTSILRRVRLRRKTVSGVTAVLPEAAGSVGSALNNTMWDGMELAVQVLPEPETQQLAAGPAAGVTPAPAAAGGAGTNAFFASSTTVSLSTYRPGGGVALGASAQPVLCRLAWFDRSRWLVGARREVLLSTSETLSALGRRFAALPGLAEAQAALVEAVSAPFASVAAAASSSLREGTSVDVTDCAAQEAAAASVTTTETPAARLRAALRYAIVATGGSSMPPARTLPDLPWHAMAADLRTVGSVASGIIEGCTILLCDSDVPLRPLSAADREQLGMAQPGGAAAAGASSSSSSGSAFTFEAGAGVDHWSSGSGSKVDGAAGGYSFNKYGSLGSDTAAGAGVTGAAATKPGAASQYKYRSKETSLRILTKTERDAAKKAAAAASLSPLADASDAAPTAGPSSKPGEGHSIPGRSYDNPLAGNKVGFAAERAKIEETRAVLAAVAKSDRDEDGAGDPISPLPLPPGTCHTDLPTLAFMEEVD